MRALATVVVSSLIGCAPVHVQLPPPPDRDASFIERTDYYDAYKPISADRVTTVSMVGKTPVVQSGIPFLQLANGTRVTHPEDLLPAVDTSSPTAVAVTEAMAARDTASLWLWGSIGVMGLGTGIALASIPASSLLAGPDDFGSNSAVLLLGLLGGTAVMTASLIPMMVGLGEGQRAQNARETAFTTFDASLKKRLGLREKRAAEELVDDGDR